MLWNAVVYCVEHSEFFHRRKKMNRDFYTIVAHILTLKHSCQYKYTQRHTCGSNIPPKTEPYDTTPTNRFDSVKMCAWHLMCVHSWAELTWYHFFFFRFCTTTDYGLRCFFSCATYEIVFIRETVIFSPDSVSGAHSLLCVIWTPIYITSAKFIVLFLRYSVFLFFFFFLVAPLYITYICCMCIYFKVLVYFSQIVQLVDYSVCMNVDSIAINLNLSFHISLCSRFVLKMRLSV